MFKRVEPYSCKITKEEENKNCEIRINNELIPFNHFYVFKNKGKYQINI